MGHRLERGQPLLVIEAQEAVEEVDAVVRDVALVLGRDEARPRLLGVPPEDVVELGGEVDVVFLVPSKERVSRLIRISMR